MLESAARPLFSAAPGAVGESEEARAHAIRKRFQIY
jgi:hypothetical protein